LPRAVTTSVAVACALALAASGLACSAPARGNGYERSLAAGERAQSAGRFGDAASEYDRASRAARLPRDAAHARYLSARMLVRGGNLRDAAVVLHAIADASPPGEDSALAAYELADLALASDHEADGWAAMDAFVRRFPGSGVAPRALRRMIRHDEETGKKEALDHLRRLQPAVDATEVGELVAYQIAIEQRDLGDIAGARDALIAVTKRWPYPGGALWDDALFHASELDEQLGRYDAAIAELETMLAQRETSHMMGTYQRPLYTPALVRIGVLYRDRMHDRARARDAFHRLYTDFDTSVNRDDALWEEALLWRDEGDTGTACVRMRTLVREFPDSRYVPCAAEQCPGVVRADKSQAPRECHAYLKRNTRYGQARTE
jgi:outer membrane protein assembly factor BamD (BamD/ComL family)